MWPKDWFGKMALIATAVGLGSWVVLPMITTVFRETVPFTDSGGMPLIGMALVDIAVVLNVYAVWLRKERSQMSILSLVVIAAAGLFFTFMVVGELLGGA